YLLRDGRPSERSNRHAVRCTARSSTRTDRRCWPPRPHSGSSWWPSRLVATAAEDRLSIRPAYVVWRHALDVGLGAILQQELGSPRARPLGGMGRSSAARAPADRTASAVAAKTTRFILSSGETVCGRFWEH